MAVHAEDEEHSKLDEYDEEEEEEDDEEEAVVAAPPPVAEPAPVAADSALATLRFRAIKFSSEPVSRWLMLAYDDLYSIQYMRKNLRPYWRRNGWEAADLLEAVTLS